MSLFLKKFETETAYTAAESSLELPNVSYIVETNDVAYKPYNPTIHVASVSLNKNALNLNVGETETLVATVLPIDATDKSVTWSSSDNTVATVDSNGLVTAVASGDCVITVTTNDGDYTAQCSTTVITPAPSHDYVEIGGIKWATMNVGANRITDAGLYFQWGDTSGYTAAQVGSGSGQKYFGWSDYKYSNNGGSSASDMTKYNSTDGKTVLEASDDGVAANWGGNWRMPTSDEFAALGTATTSAWTADYEGSGVSGLVLTSTADTNVKLFFPAAGYAYDGSLNSVGCYGYCWSSSLSTSNVVRAYYMCFDSTTVYWQYNGLRRYGFPLRGVLAE